MGIISWILVGLTAGCIASLLTGAKSSGCVTNIIIGMIGSLIGGALVGFFTYGEFRITTFTGFNLTSILVSTLGAVIFLSIINLGKKK